MSVNYEKIFSSKGMSWSLLVFSLFFTVFDLATGNVFFGLLMAGLTVYWAWNTYTIYKGTNRGYNQARGIHH